eukprot:2601638-Pleurochrysis_carterae.AAC.3
MHMKASRAPQPLARLPRAGRRGWTLSHSPLHPATTCARTLDEYAFRFSVLLRCKDSCVSHIEAPTLQTGRLNATSQEESCAMQPPHF